MAIKKLSIRSSKPDDYFQNGAVEVSRYGNVVSMRSQITPREHIDFKKQLVSEYADFIHQIDEKVALVREKIKTCNPLQLLNFISLMCFRTMINKFSEASYDTDENLTMRAVEYVQSVLVSTSIDSHRNVAPEDDTSRYLEILELVKDLYAKMGHFLFYWSAYYEDKHPDVDPNMIEYIVEAQLMNMVRGDRYPVYEAEHLKALLTPHNEVMVELFQVSAHEFIEGIVKLQIALSSERARAADVFINALEERTELLCLEDAKEECDPCEDLIALLERMLGTSLNDVSEVTGWNKSLITSLSYELNECTTFFDNSEFNGWPLRDLPIQKRPFVIIDQVAYCFDYYSLFDNIYRVMQKTIRAMKPEYEATWSRIQQNTSESMVEDLFLKMLPGSVTYRDNYYPKSSSLKECAENDLLVIYEGTVFVVEVKAGSFTYTPPITDYEAHVASFKSLIEKGDHQCDRTLNYIQSKEEAPIYDQHRQLKAVLKRGEIERFYKFCVTVDNFNEFASKAEKISFLNLHNGTISISLDDLRVYSDYFSSPLCFLHFVEQRRRATAVPNIALHDELDHLGMYIRHNIYSKTAMEMGDVSFIVWSGYREDLDKYFCGLYYNDLAGPKPEQSIPAKMMEILVFLDRATGLPGRVHLSNLLLDLSSDGREQIAATIEAVLEKQSKTGRMHTAMAGGEVSYSLFVHQPGIKVLDTKQISDRVYSAMLRNEEQERFRIELYYNESLSLERLEFKRCRVEEIPPERKSELLQLAEQIAHARVESYKREIGGRKIGRNELCPCGSGKKYKRCCGR